MQLNKIEPSITLSESEIKNLWTQGVLNDTTYIALVLQLPGVEREYEPINIAVFAARWKAEYVADDNSDRTKTLTRSSIEKAIDLLDKRGYLVAKHDVGFSVLWQRTSR
jgi:hypothetical protein